MTTWTCCAAQADGLICGLQTVSPLAPDHRCSSGHHFTSWSPLPLWTCGGDGGKCKDRRVSAATPTSPCALGAHVNQWLSIVTKVEVHATSPASVRRRLPAERTSITRTFRLKYVHRDGTPDVMHLYFIVGCYADGTPGEVFVTVDRMGSLARGALDATAMMASMLLQHGVPLTTVTGKLRHTRYEPAGFTGDPEFPSCTSPLDLLAQWLERRFPEKMS